MNFEGFLNSKASSTPNNILIFGGTGALGSVLTRRILEGYTNEGRSGEVLTVFSRDEAKHYKLRNELGPLSNMMRNHVGDIRDFSAVLDVIRAYEPRLIINCSALKQVPLCEQFIEEAVKTNVLGMLNVARAINTVRRDMGLITISTDKMCKPINAYGHTKALQEKITLTEVANSSVVRYGNVLESTGSVIPFFKALLAKGKKLPVTDKRMTRFLLSLDDAVDLIFSAMHMHRGIMHRHAVLVPRLKAASIQELAEVLCEAHGRDPHANVYETQMRPGEKLHEILVAEHEAHRVHDQGRYFTIGEFPYAGEDNKFFEAQFCSNHPDVLLNKASLHTFLRDKGVLQCSPSESQALQAS